MTSFGLVAHSSDAARRIKEVGNNLGNENFFQNPFRGCVRSYPDRLFIVSITPLYPKFYYIGFAPIVLSLLFGGGFWSKLLSVFGGLILATRVFWWGRFYYYLFYYKTRGKVSFLSSEEALSKVVLYGAR